jgi:hypothetical protein
MHADGNVRVLSQVNVVAFSGIRGLGSKRPQLRCGIFIFAWSSCFVLNDFFRRHNVSYNIVTGNYIITTCCPKSKSQLGGIVSTQALTIIACAAQLRSTLYGNVAQARETLQHLLNGPIKFKMDESSKSGTVAVLIELLANINNASQLHLMRNPAPIPFDLELAGTCTRLPIKGLPCMVRHGKDHNFIWLWPIDK